MKRSTHRIGLFSIGFASMVACGSAKDIALDAGAGSSGAGATAGNSVAGRADDSGGNGSGNVGSRIGGGAAGDGVGGSTLAGAGGALSGDAGAASLAGDSGAAGDVGLAGGPPATLDLTGDITNVHDPQIVEEGGVYYLFSTGLGISVHTSTDLHAWQSSGQVFAKKPSWITTTDASNANHLWAPEVAFFGGKFHLFYAASKFGSQNSCIGHATRDSLGDTGGWTDSGKAVVCSSSANDYNAIDPHPFVDEQGGVWLALGSFWSGLKLLALNGDGSRQGTDVYSLATRPNTAVEAPYLAYRGGFYYLFESVDACCQGAASTYKIMVGRSPNVLGPFADQDGKALSAGGGTLLLAGDTRWRGPGHNAVLHTAGRDYNVYHAYDAENDGVPTLRISELNWAPDGWPESAGP